MRRFIFYANLLKSNYFRGKMIYRREGNMKLLYANNKIEKVCNDTKSAIKNSL